MNIIELQPAEQSALNGFFGDILGDILSPGSSNQSEQLVNELYYKEQELLKTQQQKTIATIAAGVFGAATFYFGYKNFKNK